METFAPEGVIVKGVGGLYYARDPEGEVHVLRAKGKFRKQRVTPMVGDRVRFTGSKIYASSYKNGKGIAVPNFDATVKNKNSQAHPYLIKAPGREGYEGWANKDDLRLI